MRCTTSFFDIETLSWPLGAPLDWRTHEIFKESAEGEDSLALGGDFVQLGVELQVERAEGEVQLARI